MNTNPVSASHASSAMASQAAAQAAGAAPKAVADFTELLTDQLQQINQQFAKSQGGIDQFLAGDMDNVHNVVLEATKAELTFRMLMETRNQLTQQFQEVMRMQI